MLTRSALPLELDERLAWRELWGSETARDTWPFLREAWQDSAPTRWWSWLELMVLYLRTMGRAPPLWCTTTKQFTNQATSGLVSPAAETILGRVKAFRRLWQPFLERSGLQEAPQGTRPDCCTLLHSVPLRPWRPPERYVSEVHQVLHTWFPNGLKKQTEMDVLRSLPLGNQQVPKAPAELFPPGSAAERPLKRPRR